MLREAGVVDAGGYGVIVIFAGRRGRAARRGGRPQLEHHAPARVSHPAARVLDLSATARTSRSPGPSSTPRAIVGALEALGDSVLVVGDARTLKVHVHTDDPETAIAVFAGAGEVSRLDVADMRTQVAQRERPPGRNGQSLAARTGVLAVVSGAGMARLYAVLGAHVLDGGPTLNPSTYELLAGIHAVPAEEVVVLPNSANVIMAAERAAELSEKAGARRARRARSRPGWPPPWP